MKNIVLILTVLLVQCDMYESEQINRRYYQSEQIPRATYENVGEVINIIAGETLTIYGDAVANVPIDNTLAVVYTCEVGTQSGNDFILNVATPGEYWLYIHAINEGVTIRATKSKLNVLAKRNTEVEISQASFYDWVGHGPPLYGWELNANNTIAIIETDKVEITYVDGTNGGWVKLNTITGLLENLIEGEQYIVRAYLKCVGAVRARVYQGATYSGYYDLTTEYAEYEWTITKETGEAFLTFVGMGAGERVYSGYVKVFKITSTATLVGNSLMASGGDNELDAIRAIFDSMTWVGVGLTGIAPNLREGYSGKTYVWLITDVDSPFMKAGVLDIPAYYADNALETPDFIYLRMGVNDAVGYISSGFTEAQQTTWVGYITTLIDAFLAHDSYYRIVIGIPTLSENTGDGWENNYGPDPGHANQNQYLDNIHTMWDLIIANFVDYDPRVSVAFTTWFLDRDDGYPKTGGIHTNGVHPAAEGYEELGQGLAAHLNSLL